MKIILASESQFKKHALDVLGIEYETIPGYFDESSIRHDDPHSLVQKLAEAKAKKIGEEHEESIVVASDLIVAHNNAIYEKPKDEAEAKEMLQSLSGNNFYIIAGLAVYNSSTQSMLSTSEYCEVKFRNLSEYEIDDYIAKYPVTKCAAAFEADGLLRFAEHVQGSYVFRAAMPVEKLVPFLRENGVKV
jgi:septum formation protein